MSRIAHALRRFTQQADLSDDESGVELDAYPIESGVPLEEGRPPGDVQTAVSLLSVGSTQPHRQQVEPPSIEAPPAPTAGSTPAWDTRRFSVSEPLSKTAASLQRVQESTGLKTVVLTGLVGSEDNAGAAIELSIALAAGSARVLLVDAAMEPPFPDRLIDDPHGLGPANLGRGTGSAAPLISVAPTLDLAPIGAHVLAGRESASTAARTLASRYGAHYDWIVLRGPVLSSEEATQAVRHLGAGVVFLVSGTSAFPEVGRQIALIGRDQVVATVLVGLSGVNR